MGCCFSSRGEDGEREPIVPKNQNQPESARSRPTANDTRQKTGSFSARHVDVPDLDLRFKDVSETFNKQQENYKQMKEMLQCISRRYQLSTNDSLSQCLKKIKEEHDEPYIGLEVKGYDFTLVVRSEAEIPDKLKRTQEDFTELSKAAKGVMSVGTKLQEMIDSLLQAEEGITRQVEEAQPIYQERKRLVDNLKENLREAKRAKELSPKYRNEAGDLLKEVAKLSGITP
ncbi:uncharacterized protein si:ch73-345f18.3 [Triplophysa dalaica]|uniref:uncharacterized protein si:ch73-345f18.3 n=1 Tax=Triplophysa dalaica TaxID=1582913 RepID=UPI0024DFF998|nr:uncharacterized protein si:ch73-345f18.3 [Triplophysa dalaica]